MFVLIIITGLLSAQRHDDATIPLPGSNTISWSPREPREGEVVDITLEVTSGVDVSTNNLHIGFHPTGNAEIIGKETIRTSIKKGETKFIKTQVKFFRPSGGVFVMARAIFSPGEYKRSWGDLAHMNFSLLFDTLTNTFVTDEEYWSRRVKPKPPLPPEYTYDIVAGMHTKDILPETEAKKVRLQIDSLKQLDSTLTDGESLEMLHDVEVQMLVRYGISNKEESVPILIKTRKMMREQGLSKWEAVDKVVEQKKEKGWINFFRPDGSGNTGYSASSDSTPKQKTDVTLTGTVEYKKHLTDKDIGLDTTTVDMPLRFAKVYFWAYWSGTGGHFVGPALTDNNGQFTYTVGGVVLPDARFMPVVFLRGPGIPTDSSGFDRVKAITDTIKLTWIPSPEDSQTWRYRWKVDTVDVSYYDFGIKYCAEHFMDGGLWPDNHQPRSGAANIYDYSLKGYEYLVNNNYASSDTIYKVVARWGPGRKLATKFKGDTILTNPDSIFVSGDTTGQLIYYTDEWDDYYLLHEFGHHIQWRCSEMPPSITSPHEWYRSYPTDTCLAYKEGWPSMFAGVVTGNIRAIDSWGMIGSNNEPYYHNNEDPWDFNKIPNPADSFEGGPYCEGAVCGALWDIYDATGEIPYPSYPDSLNGVWFPDTALADSLTMAFNEIWNITDNYKYLGHHCWTIYDFLRGWGNYHYDHQFGLNQIILHHRILWDVPAAPRGLQARYEGTIPGVVLTWLKNTEPDLYNYYIYRKIDLPDSVFKRIGAPFPALDTNFTDTNVEIGKSYWYAVTAMDSVSNESELSDSVLVRLALHEEVNNPAGTGYNNATRIIRFLHRGRGYDLLLAFSSEDSVKCVSSSDEGVTWSQSQVIAQGQFPTLVLDSQGNPCCLFGRWVGPGGFGSAQLYYTKYIDNHWTTPALLMSVDSVYIGIPRYAIPAPSASVDSQDTIHVTWMSPMGQEYIHRFAVWYGNLYAFDTIPVFNYVQLDTIWVYESSPCPALAIDGLQIIHVVYETDPAAPTLFYRYRESGIWREKETIESDGCYYPDLEFFGDRIHLVWDYRYPDTTVAHALHYRSKSVAGWDTIMNIYEPLPFNIFGKPVNAGGWYTIWANQDIYYSRFNGATWGIPETVKVTPELSVHPTALFRQDLSDTCLYIAWTEGDSAPYRVEFEKITVPTVPKYYADVGQPVQSPYCLERNGYWIFGSEPYKTTDWGYDNLRYKFTNLDPQKVYRLELSYYFENKPQSNTDKGMDVHGVNCSGLIYQTKEKQSNSKLLHSKDEILNRVQNDRNDGEAIEGKKGIGRIIQALVVDGVPLDTAFITPNKLVRISVWLKKESYADGEIISEIQRIKGKRVVCGEISLFEFNPQQKEIAAKGGAQQSQTILVSKTTAFNIYPNPAKGNVNIRLQMPTNSQVQSVDRLELKIYDVSGRLIKQFNHLTIQPFNQLIWNREDGLDRIVPAGVYFCELEISDKNTQLKKLILIK